MTNANYATANIADDTEALKHNFFFRNFFHNRGYYNLTNISPGKYEKDPLFKNPSNARVWLPAGQAFVRDPDGVEQLTAQGKSLLDDSVANQGPKLEQDGAVTFATVGLPKKDYDQYYRGFSNATLWPVFHYRNDLAVYDRDEYAGYRRVNSWLAHRAIKLLQPDDVIWVHDYHLIPFGEALRSEGVTNRMGFFLHIPFPSPQILLNIPPHEELVKSLCCYDVVGFQTPGDQAAFHDYIVRHAHGTATADGEVEAFGRKLKTGVYRIGKIGRAHV